MFPYPEDYKSDRAESFDVPPINVGAHPERSERVSSKLFEAVDFSPHFQAPKIPASNVPQSA
jgi:hypothetical protein